MWRALAVFRFAALAYAGALVIWRASDYAHPVGGWVVLAGMVVWTFAATVPVRPPRLATGGRCSSPTCSSRWCSCWPAGGSWAARSSRRGSRSSR